MGVALALVTGADVTSREHYASYEATWRHSAGCQAAAFLSVLSSHVSTLLVCCITVNKLLTLRVCATATKPEYNCATRSVAAACGLAWLAGSLAASALLLSVQRSVDRSSGLCLLLPILSGVEEEEEEDEKDRRSAAVLTVAVFDLVVLLATAGSHLRVLWSTRGDVIVTDPSATSRAKRMARRLQTVVASHVLCFLPVFVPGVLAGGGLPVSSQVTTGLAVFLLPLCSGLHPLLYAFSMAVERRRRFREERCLKWLQSRASTVCRTT